MERRIARKGRPFPGVAHNFTLLPCPFCGETDIRIRKYVGMAPGYKAKCTNCGAIHDAFTPDGFLNIEGAAERWNKRV